MELRFIIVFTTAPMKCTQIGDNVNVFSVRMMPTAAVDAARETSASAVSGQSLVATLLFKLILTCHLYFTKHLPYLKILQTKVVELNVI